MKPLTLTRALYEAVRNVLIVDLLAAAVIIVLAGLYDAGIL